MSETPTGEIENITDQVDSDAKGEPSHRRYSFKGIQMELKEVVWLSPKATLAALGAVIMVTFFVSFALFGLDKVFSETALWLYANAPDAGVALQWVLGIGWAGSLVSSIFFALKHPSPGDTLASIFGGQIVAQGSGLSPREKRLERRMMLSVGAFLIFSLAFGLVF